MNHQDIGYHKVHGLFIVDKDIVPVKDPNSANIDIVQKCYLKLIDHSENFDVSDYNIGDKVQCVFYPEEIGIVKNYHSIKDFLIIDYGGRVTEDNIDCLSKHPNNRPKKYLPGNKVVHFLNSVKSLKYICDYNFCFTAGRKYCFVNSSNISDVISYEEACSQKLVPNLSINDKIKCKQRDAIIEDKVNNLPGYFVVRFNWSQKVSLEPATKIIKM